MRPLGLPPLGSRPFLSAAAIVALAAGGCTTSEPPGNLNEDIVPPVQWELGLDTEPAGDELPPPDAGEPAPPEDVEEVEIKDFPPEPDVAEEVEVASPEPDPVPDIPVDPEAEPEPNPEEIVTCCQDPSVCGLGFDCDAGCGCVESEPLCNPADCAFGQGCNINTNQCEQIGQCGSIGQACDPEIPDAGPMVCVPYGDQGQGICREQCIGPPPGDPNPCLNGICAALPNTLGWCLPMKCKGFFQNDCGPDATCLPSLDGTNFCVPDGEGQLGDPCVLHNECGHDILCIDEVCAQPNCAPVSAVKKCAPGVECFPMTELKQGKTLDIGTCAVACDVFFPDQCPVGTWCYPNTNAPEPGPIDGHCTKSFGDAPEGAECLSDPNVCSEGLGCVESKDGVKCEKFCDPDPLPPLNLGACPPGRGCQPLVLAGDSGGILEVMDFGTCVPACKVWAEQGQTGCSASKWCVPFMFNGEFGDCSGQKGAVPPYEPCLGGALETTCQEGTLCADLEGAPEGLEGPLCRILCQVGVDGTGQPGDTCSDDEFCDALLVKSDTGKTFDADVGFCSQL